MVELKNLPTAGHLFSGFFIAIF